MPLQVYNTLTRKKEPFETIEPGKVSMYLCGPTVYKPAHIGHMVGPVIFDTVKRYLAYNGYDVTYVINITDVDDKLINKAVELDITVKALAEQMTADYFDNLMKALRENGVHVTEYFYDSDPRICFAKSDDKRPQRDPLKIETHDIHDDEGAENRDNQRPTDDQSHAPAHG